MNDVEAYLDEARKIPDFQPKSARALVLMRYFLQWRLSLREGATPTADQRPWLTFGAITHLKSITFPGARVFEFGAGGSTLFFLRRAANVVSVDHDPQWIDALTALVRSHGYDNWQSNLIEPIPNPASNDELPTDPDGYISSDEQYKGMSFRAYATSIDRFPDGHFDIVLVDGRARPSCAKHAHGKVRAGGHLVLDNSERYLYAYVREELVRLGWTCRNFYGPGPYNRGFWQTSIFKRPPDTRQ